jgi:hypothetical protein
MLVDIVEVYSFLGMAESGAVIAQHEKRRPSGMVRL